MNGAHDMGGVHGFGPVVPEADEPTFHADWERRTFALALAAGRAGQWNLDMMRFAFENRSPSDYLSKSYYERWLAGLETMLKERGLITEDEIKAGRSLGEPKKVDGILHHGNVEAIFARGRPTERPTSVTARYRIGDRVQARNINPSTHTRLPRYVRGRPGVIERINGCHVFPDSNALGQGENPQWLYTVRFTARDLWGPDADQMFKVSVDAWEPYLEPADQAH